MMEKKRKVALALSGLLLAAVLLSGCIDETPTKTVTSIPTSSPTPSPTPTPEATPPSPTPTPEVTPPILVKKEIHQDFDATPALAGLLYPSVSNLTPADIGFEVAMTDEINSLFDIGKPMVPYIIKIFEIPGDSDIELVSVNFSNPLEIDNVFIEPAQPPVIAGGADRDYWRNITPPPIQ